MSKAVELAQITELIALKAFLSTKEGELFLQHYELNPDESVIEGVNVNYRETRGNYLVRGVIKKVNPISNICLRELIYVIISETGIGELSLKITKETQGEITSFAEPSEERDEDIKINYLEKPHVRQRLERYSNLVSRQIGRK